MVEINYGRQCYMCGESEHTKTYVFPGLHFPPQGPLWPFFIPDSFFYYLSEDSRSSRTHIFGVFLVPLAGSYSMWSQETVLLRIGLRLILSEPHLCLTQKVLRTPGYPWCMCLLCPLRFHPCSGLQHPMASKGPTHWRRQCSRAGHVYLSQELWTLLLSVAS